MCSAPITLGHSWRRLYPSNQKICLFTYLLWLVLCSYSERRGLISTIEGREKKKKKSLKKIRYEQREAVKRRNIKGGAHEGSVMKGL